jgi:hypothetical protein
VEDIVDSGRTLARLVDLLGERGPRSLEICALLHKHIATHLQHPVRFVGFDAPEEFLVGYGLDHAEHFGTSRTSRAFSRGPHHPRPGPAGPPAHRAAIRAAPAG